MLGDGLSDDEAIGDKLSDRLAGVGVGDLGRLVRVEPDLALTTADDRGGQALLSSQIDPVSKEKKILATTSPANHQAQASSQNQQQRRQCRSPISSSAGLLRCMLGLRLGGLTS